MNLVTSVQGVKVLRLIQVPEHGGSVLTTGCAERSIWRNSDSVDVAGVSDVVGLQTAGRELPNLDKLVPSAADNDWVLGVGAESHAGNPFGVSLVGNGEFAVAEGVPQLDSTIS